MKEAREKLKEARYFLGQMQDEKTQPEFQYNLSAFLSASRSVTFYLQKEYRDHPEFEDWYSQVQDVMQDSELFRAIVEGRNQVQKEAYPRITSLRTTKYEDPGEYDSEDVSVMPFEALGQPSIPEQSVEDYDEVEILSMDVLPFDEGGLQGVHGICGHCERYLDRLERFLDEWESRVTRE